MDTKDVSLEVKKDYGGQGDTTLTYPKRKGTKTRPREETLKMIEKERDSVLKEEIISNYMSNSTDKRQFKKVLKNIWETDPEGFSRKIRMVRGGTSKGKTF